MSTWHYYNENREKIGPVTGRELKQLVRQGTVTLETCVEDPTGRTGLAKDVKGLPFHETAQPKTAQSESSSVSLPPPAGQNPFAMPMSIAENPFAHAPLTEQAGKLPWEVIVFIRTMVWLLVLTGAIAVFATVLSLRSEVERTNVETNLTQPLKKAPEPEPEPKEGRINVFDMKRSTLPKRDEPRQESERTRQILQSLREAGDPDAKKVAIVQELRAIQARQNSILLLYATVLVSVVCAIVLWGFFFASRAVKS